LSQKGGGLQEYFVYFKSRQRICGEKDLSGAEIMLSGVCIYEKTAFSQRGRVKKR